MDKIGELSTLNAATIKDLAEQSAESLAASQAAGAAQSQEQLGSLLESLASLAEEKQTTDEDRKNKIVLWVSLGVVALAALLIWKR